MYLLAVVTSREDRYGWMVFMFVLHLYNHVNLLGTQVSRIPTSAASPGNTANSAVCVWWCVHRHSIFQLSQGVRKPGARPELERILHCTGDRRQQERNRQAEQPNTTTLFTTTALAARLCVRNMRTAVSELPPVLI